jgi:hypothetical protein
MKFVDANHSDLASWYHENNRNHYAISVVVANYSPKVLEDSCFEEEIALGFLDLSKWRYTTKPEIRFKEELENTNSASCQSKSWIFSNNQSLLKEKSVVVIKKYDTYFFGRIPNNDH